MARFLKMSFRAKDTPLMSGRITVRLTDILKVQKDIKDLDENYNVAKGIMDSVRAHWESEPDDSLSRSLELELCRMVFGSNYIERAGSNFEETLFLCKKIFRGEGFAKGESGQRTEDYEAGLVAMLRGLQTTDTPGTSGQHVSIRGRLEVIQHAKALKFFLEQFSFKDSTLTEELILDTHKILCEGHEHDDGTPWEEWAGKYRDCEIAASSVDKDTGKRKKSIFIRASSVPAYTRQLVCNFNSWISKHGSNTDPFELAGWLCTQFVKSTRSLMETEGCVVFC
ncbi:hypothetical protein AA313_de0204762 [Arthrobotrys entomopaga]|nr:hypothetical protein AA313_de0204762 [Arthrobotrys entomopaga]